MIIQELHTGWKMRKLPAEEWLSAKVPGSVYNDLLLNKKMDDPYWRDNEDKAFALLENDFEYQCTFPVSQKLISQNRVLLRCEGLDTLAELFLNDKPLGKADNMHRIWEFDVTRFLNKEKNDLRVIFRSPVNFVGEIGRASCRERV